MSEDKSKAEVTVDGVSAEAPRAEEQPTNPPDAEAKQSTSDRDTEERPGAQLKQGLSLLWKAATGTAQEIKREIGRSGVSDTLQQAGRDLEGAANQAAKSLESFIEKVQPKPPKYSQQWPQSPPPEPPSDQADPPSSPPEPEKKQDGGTTETGERRDMRIQVDDEQS
jgi:hypothetical protein